MQWTADLPRAAAGRCARLVALAAIALLAGGCYSLTGKDPTRRTPLEAFDDEVIERNAKRELAAADERLARSHINAESYDGIVLLTGQVADEALRSRAEQAVARVAKVRRVHNEIEVGGGISLFARANDGWLQTKVMSRFAVSDQVDATRIKVVAENGVVYLMGEVPRDHAQAAAEVASTVFGVSRVVKVFDYN